MIEENSVRKINCYTCQKEADKNEFFPFCSSECKEEWNKDKEEVKQKKVWTIPLIQSRLKEMALAVKNKNTEIKKIDGGDQLYDVAKLIFG